MKGQQTWNYTPYMRMCDNYKKMFPYICRLAPYADYCELEWFDTGDRGTHSIVCHQRGGSKPDVIIETQNNTVTIPNLLPGREYEVRVIRKNNPAAASDYRFFRAGDIIGTVINYLHPHDNAFSCSGKYLCSPCIIKTDTGRLLVSMDVYGPATAQNLSFIYKSDDRGKTWQYICDLLPCFWGKLFTHRGAIYLLSMTAEYGELQIGCSRDDGNSWSKPVTLFPGCGIRHEKGMHQAPTPVITHQGRIWTAVDYGSWEKGGHESALVSADENADLLDPASWTCGEFVPYNRNWPGAVPHSKWGGHEGNAVVSPSGEVCNFLRYQISQVFDGHVDNSVLTHGKAFILKQPANNPEAPLDFYKFVDFNGGMSKFVIRKDEKTQLYLAVVNKVIDDTTPAQRNILSLSVSRDLERWTIVHDIIDASEFSVHDTGFQYPDFIVDGDDLLIASRTAFNHANNFHDSNYITFHICEQFRNYIHKADNQ